MSDLELKKRLIQRIQRSKNSQLLREAYRLMGTDPEDLDPYALSKAEAAAIKRGRNDVKAGRVLTAKEANKAIDEWLGK